MLTSATPLLTQRSDIVDKAAHPTNTSFNTAIILEVVKKDEFHSFHPLAYFWNDALPVSMPCW